MLRFVFVMVKKPGSRAATVDASRKDHLEGAEEHVGRQVDEGHAEQREGRVDVDEAWSAQGYR